MSNDAEDDELELSKWKRKVKIRAKDKKWQWKIDGDFESLREKEI